jgi:hypothetical protein
VAGTSVGAVGTEVLAEVAHAVHDVLRTVFATVAEVGAACEARFAAVAAEGRRPRSSDLAPLRPGLCAGLTGDGVLMSGLGFVSAPTLLDDTDACLEWWLRDRAGHIDPLVLEPDGAHSAYADYTHWDWYTHPRDTGRPFVAGPYVDYLCSDEYGLTFALPVRHEGRFAGVAAADVYLRDFETATAPLLARLPGPARLVNSRGRVAVSTDPGHLAGSLTKGPDFTALPAPTVQDGLLLFPCTGTTMLLVTGAASV